MKITIAGTEGYYFVRIDEKFEDNLCRDEVLGAVASAIYSRHAQNVRTREQHEAYKTTHPHYTVPVLDDNTEPLCVVESIEGDTAYNVSVGDKFSGSLTDCEALYTVARLIITDYRPNHWLKTYQQWCNRSFARKVEPVALLR